MFADHDDLTLVSNDLTFAQRLNIHVTFVIDSRKQWLGSTRMRSEQLGLMLKSMLGDGFTYSVDELPSGRTRKLLWVLSQPKRAVIFFTKGSLPCVNQRLLDFLRMRGHCTCIDYVDSDLRRCVRLRPTVHVAASLKAEAVLKGLIANSNTGGRIALIHHSADARLLNFEALESSQVRAVYLGLPSNAFWTDRIDRMVTMLDASSTQMMDKSIQRLHEFNLHYCVRPTSVETQSFVAKPFTKGFTASYCRAPVILGRGEYDGVRLLGEDYPYLTSMENDEAEVLECLERASSNFGNDEWQYALERVVRLRSVCSPAAIANQFAHMLREISCG